MGTGRRRRDVVAEILAGGLWGLLVAIVVLTVVSGWLGRYVRAVRVLDPSTGAPLPFAVVVVGALLGAYWRYRAVAAGATGTGR